MDLHEDSEKNLVTATFEFPGVSKGDIYIETRDGMLTVSTETKPFEGHNDNDYAVRERRYGKYFRTLSLPQGIKVRSCFQPFVLGEFPDYDSHRSGCGDQGFDGKRYLDCYLPEVESWTCTETHQYLLTMKSHPQ